MSDLKIAILGAGVIGLTTGLELQKEIKNANISIIADKFFKDTTSYVAAGVFRPGTSFCGPTDDITKKWITDSYYYWDDLRLTAHAANAGVTQVSGYIFSSTSPSITRNHYIEKLVPIYRAATEEELQLCPGDWKYGSFYTTVLTECGLYLPWAMMQFTKSGGKLIDYKLESFGDLSSEYDLIINCTGLGAKYLCNDHKVAPIRGQVFKVKAPWVKTFFYADYDTYIIPGFSSVTLGGCRQYDSYNLNIDKYDSLSIKERCEAFLPSLKGAEVVAERVGLRPHRDPVRIEKEIVNVNGKRLKIVHNYGHGGYGVTVAPGTSIYAVKLAKELLMGNSKL
ncbi:FAD dependent oxidoreductase [Popillia japonica]|uniref:FAD dependent oxidoreductase n=1 Tax=Popillia japonica TaxID=7064 RepID=A0AAW1MBM7_POPJA